MRTYTFLIGTMDDFESIEELIDYTEAIGVHGIKDCFAYEFEAPIECNEETVTRIGRGIAFGNGWCMDDTYSCMIDGSLEDQGVAA